MYFNGNNFQNQNFANYSGFRSGGHKIVFIDCLGKLLGQI